MSANENNSAGSILARLMAVIEERRQSRPVGSYTTKLLDGGVPAIGAKVREEAEEVVAAAGESGPDGRAHVIHEAADVIYHLLVLLAVSEVSLIEVERELGRRFGISGLDEKASRTKPSS